MWMPLVTWEMGISSAGTPGQTCCHMLRDTWPCSSLTPLAKRLRRRASTVMQKVSDLLVGILAAQGQQALDADAQLVGLALQVGADQVGVEMVVARRHRSVGGEHVAGPDHLEGRFEVEALVLHQQVDALEGQEGRVALVQVADGGLEAQGDQGPQAADAQQDLLADAHVVVAAVQPAGQFAVLGPVLGQVGVQQEQGVAADLHAPDPGLDHAAGVVDLDGALGCPSSSCSRDMDML